MGTVAPASSLLGCRLQCASRRSNCAQRCTTSDGRSVRLAPRAAAKNNVAKPSPNGIPLFSTLSQTTEVKLGDTKFSATGRDARCCATATPRMGSNGTSRPTTTARLESESFAKHRQALHKLVSIHARDSLDSLLSGSHCHSGPTRMSPLPFRSHLSRFVHPPQVLGVLRRGYKD
jgi:hypothetical protein